MSLCILALRNDGIVIAADGRRGACIQGRTVPLYDFDRKLAWINEHQMLFVGGMTIPSENVKSQVFERLTLKGYNLKTSLKIISEVCWEQHNRFKHLIEDEDFLTTVTAVFAGIFDGRPIIAGFSTVNNFEPQIVTGSGQVCVRGFLDKEALAYFLEKLDPKRPLDELIFSTFAYCASLDNKVGGSCELFMINNSGVELLAQRMVSRRQAHSSFISGNVLQTSHIGNGVIVNAHIGEAQIINAKIADLAVNTAKISDLAVTNAKIADLSVTNAKIANLAVTDAKISSLSASKLTAGTIDASIINVTNLNASNITTGSLSANIISGGTISSSVINVSTDATIGNQLYLGASTDKVSKGITFFNDGVGMCDINMNSLGELVLSSFVGVGVYGYGSLRIEMQDHVGTGSDMIITHSSGQGHLKLLNEGSGNIYISPLSSSYCYIDGKLLHRGSQLGFFNVGPVIQQTASLLGSKLTVETPDLTYGSVEVDMLNHLKADMQSVYTKIDGILNKLALYGLFNVS